jgi:phage virion morphogenesis protein
MNIIIENNNQKVLSALKKLSSQASDPEPVLLLIGEHLEKSTKQRFQDAKDPDGNTWEKNRPTTLDFYSREFGTSAAINKKPLTGISSELQTTITYQIQGGQLLIGSPLPYAAMQHFGGTTASNSMIPGKNITARPFLGISNGDEREIIDIMHDFLLV